MAGLNVSNVLRDPRFRERGLICRRNAQAVGGNGRAINTPTDVIFDAVVTVNTGDDLERLPDGSRVKGAINIYTQHGLVVGGVNQDADDVFWRGRWYMLQSIDDYSHFGEGYVHAVATLKPLSG